MSIKNNKIKLILLYNIGFNEKINTEISYKNKIKIFFNKINNSIKASSKIEKVKIFFNKLNKIEKIGILATISLIIIGGGGFLISKINNNKSSSNENKNETYKLKEIKILSDPLKQENEANNKLAKTEETSPTKVEIKIIPETFVTFSREKDSDNKNPPNTTSNKIKNETYKLISTDPLKQEDKIINESPKPEEASTTKVEKEIIPETFPIKIDSDNELPEKTELKNIEIPETFVTFSREKDSDNKNPPNIISNEKKNETYKLISTDLLKQENEVFNELPKIIKLENKNEIKILEEISNVNKDSNTISNEIKPNENKNELNKLEEISPNDNLCKNDENYISENESSEIIERKKRFNEYERIKSKQLGRRVKFKPGRKNLLIELRSYSEKDSYNEPRRIYSEIEQKLIEKYENSEYLIESIIDNLNKEDNYDEILELIIENNYSEVKEDHPSGEINILETIIGNLTKSFSNTDCKISEILKLILTEDYGFNKENKKLDILNKIISNMKDKYMDKELYYNQLIEILKLNPNGCTLNSFYFSILENSSTASSKLSENTEEEDINEKEYNNEEKDLIGKYNNIYTNLLINNIRETPLNEKEKREVIEKIINNNYSENEIEILNRIINSISIEDEVLEVNTDEDYYKILNLILYGDYKSNKHMDRLCILAHIVKNMKSIYSNKKEYYIELINLLNENYNQVQLYDFNNTILNFKESKNIK